MKRRHALHALAFATIVFAHLQPSSALAQELSSARLRQLQQDVRSGVVTAEADFWSEVRRSGTPLVERVADDTNFVWVTFLWRDAGDTRNVVIYSGHTSSLYGFGREHFLLHSMRELPGTDVWFRTYLLPADARFTYYLSPNDDLTPSAEDTDWGVRARTWQSDPLNPREHRRPHEDREWVASLVELPKAPPLAWSERKAGVPAGRVDEHRFRSTTLGDARRVWVYTPPGYDRSLAPAHLLVMFDGWAAVHRHPTLAILDNLHADGRIQPVVAVMIEQLNRPEELGCSERFTGVVADELLPWIRSRYSVTSRAEQTIVSGGSRGGLAAACAALFRPNVFGAVFSGAGQFVWKAGESELEHENARADANYGWVMRELASRSRLPVRFFLAVGRFDRGGDYPFLLANRHLRDVLIAKGYFVEYWEFGGGHEDANPMLGEMLLGFFSQDSPKP